MKYVREFNEGMGEAVARRTYLRTKLTDTNLSYLSSPVVLNLSDPHWTEWYVACSNSGIEVQFSDDASHMGYAPETRFETWDEVSRRVALGNVTALHNKDSSITPDTLHQNNSLNAEYDQLYSMIAKGASLTSGRHLTHGDSKQMTKDQTMFTNCSTAASTFSLFYLLLNGSGVGRDYSDAMMVVDWSKHMPKIVPVLSETHPDYDYMHHMTPREAEHLYGRTNSNKHIKWHTVGDTREGWAHAVEDIETTTFMNGRAECDNHVDVIVVDFSEVRGKGQPIMGMHGKPASGPVPCMDAMNKMNLVSNSGMKPWKATMVIDDMLAQIVLFGGLRRAARISTKSWMDPDIMEYISIKRPTEYDRFESAKECAEYYDETGNPRPNSFMSSSNNSVAIFGDFYKYVTDTSIDTSIAKQARMVFNSVCENSYYDRNGEPGFVNVDRLSDYSFGGTIEEQFSDPRFASGEFFGNEKYIVKDTTKTLMKEVFAHFTKMPYHFIVNPCGEISLSLIGGMCVISDMVLFHCDSIEESIDVAKASTRSMMRVNLMGSVYEAEVQRTNRIGISMTGVFEGAWSFFKTGFRDLINPDFDGYVKVTEEMFGSGLDVVDIINMVRTNDDPRIRAAAFWEWCGLVSRTIYHESVDYAEELGVNAPHTVTAIKPSGCRPLSALTTTDSGILTLEELFSGHVDGEEWSDFDSDISVVQDSGNNRIIKTFDNGKAKVKGIEIGYGLVVESTEQHPWWVENSDSGNTGWVETNKIKVGDVLGVKIGTYKQSEHYKIDVAAMNQRVPSTMNPDIAWFAGYMRTRLNESSWTFQKNEEALRVNKILISQFGINTTVDLSGNTASVTVVESDKWEWYRTNVLNKIIPYDPDTMPRSIRSSTNEDIAAYFAGLYDSIGLVFENETFARHLQSVSWASGLGLGLEKDGKYFTLYSTPHSEFQISYDMQHHSFYAKEDEYFKITSSEHAGVKIGKVVKIRDLGSKPTYDIEVENDHWYYDGAVKSHNTVSKLFGLTEGWHLPPMQYYMRWVMFKDDSEMLKKYQEQNYPVRKLYSYKDHHIVGFPTRHPITELPGIDGHIVTGDEVTMDEQYAWIKLGEFFYLEGGYVRDYVHNDGDIDSFLDGRGYRYGNQISVTIRVTPENTPFEEYRESILNNQSKVRCASVMPQVVEASYEYLPEEQLTKEEYFKYKSMIRENIIEDVAREHVDCSTGACPIDFNSDIAIAV